MGIGRTSKVVINGTEYVIINGEKVKGKDVCLLSTLKPPVEMKLAVLKCTDGEVEASDYMEADYQEVLFKLLQKK